MAKKVLIVGGVAGGASVAARLRRLDENAEIILLEKDGYISFANCGMPYYIGGAISEREALLLNSPELMRRRFRLDVRTHHEAISVDPARGLVKVRCAQRGEYEESYDALALCPGAEPIPLPVTEGAEGHVYTLRGVEDIDRIHQAISARESSGDSPEAPSGAPLGASLRAVVVGGGFIGLEMAENLIRRGIAVHVVEAAPHILPPFDEDIACFAQKELLRAGAALTLGTGVLRIEPAAAVTADAAGAAVVLQNGERLPADIVILAVGVRPATAFLAGSGVALGPRGHILTDAYMRTNFPNIYAAGDAVQIRDLVLDKPAAAPLAGPANRQARVVADNIAGIRHTYDGAQGTAILKLFSLTAGCTGANERMLRQEGIPYLKALAHPFSHATYYPGARQLAAKLLFSPEGRILGFQMVGAEGVDKRIDVVATALRLGANVKQLGDLELAYAPPYSSAKDPVNQLGYLAENMLEGVSDMISAEELAAMDPAGYTLLDVRTSLEYEAGHIPGAVNIPLDELRERMGELNKDRPVVVYCHVGVRAHTAQRILAQSGYRARSLSGGYRTYEAVRNGAES